MISQHRHRPFHKTREQRGRIISRPAATISEPQRNGEVQEGDHRFDTAQPQAAEHLAVALKGGLIPTPRFRFDAAPLDGQTVRILSEGCGAVEVFLRVGPPATGRSGAIAVEDATGLLFPRPPVVVDVVAFDLMRARRGPPAEPRGESQRFNALSHGISITRAVEL